MVSKVLDISTNHLLNLLTPPERDTTRRVRAPRPRLHLMATVGADRFVTIDLHNQVLHTCHN